nr:hypothetical protein [Tanacetum cinerariifolium]
MSEYSTSFPSALGSSLRESSSFGMISINITSPSSSLVQTSLALGDGGTNPSDSKSELNLRTFSIIGVTEIVLLGLEGILLFSRFIGMRGCVFNEGLFGIFHAILCVVGTTVDFTRSSDFVHLGFFGVEVIKLTTGRLVNGSSCDEIDMVIKNLDLEPKDIVAEFYGPSRQKELCKESDIKILPCGDGCCWKAFKPIASLIA